MSNLSIDNFIEDYPLPYDEDIQWKIAQRKEFNILKSNKKKNEKIGNFYNHQEIIFRYINNYDNLFNISPTGVGKTATIIRIAEYYRINKGAFKKVFIFVPGPSLVDNFITQIKKIVGDDISSKEINKWYSIETYNSFYKNSYNDEFIEEYFSDSIIFMDEIHKYNPFNVITKEDREIKLIYDFLWKLTHLSKRRKVILSSATPMTNTTKDLIPLLNLILESDKQLPLNVKDDFYNNISLEQFEPYLRGKFSYIKFSQTDIIQNDNGIIYDYSHPIEFTKKNKNPILPSVKKIVKGEIIIENPAPSKQPKFETETRLIPSKIKIYECKMQGIQLKEYKKNSKKRKDLLNIPIQTSNFVFPNGMIGKKGFDFYTEENKFKNRVFKDYVINENGSKELGMKKIFEDKTYEEKLNILRNYSSKIAFYIEQEYLSSKNKYPGNSFLFLEFVESAGASLISLLLEFFGFEEFKISFNNFDKDGNIINLKKKKRFALLNGNSINIENIIKIFNSPSNVNGEYLQMIIASKKVMLGITLANCIRGYIMSIGWNPSDIDQALGRIIRIDSYSLLKKFRENKDSDEKIKVDIYRLSSVNPELNINDEIDYSIDSTNYLRSERKEIYNNRNKKYAIQTSIDAYMNYERNTYVDEQKLIEEGLEFKKNDVYYKIYGARGPPFNKKRSGMAYNQGPNKSEYLYNTYNILYSNVESKKIREIIIEKLKYKEFLTLDELIESLKEEKIKITPFNINNAIKDIINNEITFKSYNNLITYYIVNKGFVLYRSLKSKKELSEKINTENYITFNYNYKNLYEKNSENLLIIKNEESEIYNYTREEFIEYYEITQNYSLFKKILEESLKNKYLNKLTSFDEMILDLFHNYWLMIPYPTNYINIAKKMILTKIGKLPQGRVRSENSLIGLAGFDLSEYENISDENNMVYIHYYKETGKTGFAITSLFERADKEIFILNKENMTFIPTEREYNYVYNFFFTNYINKIMEKYRVHPYYGTYILRGGEGESNIYKKRKNFFRIVKKEEGNKNKGLICKTDSSDKLKEIYYIISGKTLNVKRNELCNQILDFFKENDMLFFSL